MSSIYRGPFRIEDQHAFMSSMEFILNGFAYDNRYHYRSVTFTSPKILVVTNRMFDASLLSFDRWDFVTVDPITLDLVEHNTPGKNLRTRSYDAGKRRARKTRKEGKRTQN
jgi:hypothetical protein